MTEQNWWSDYVLTYGLPIGSAILSLALWRHERRQRIASDRRGDAPFLAVVGLRWKHYNREAGPSATMGEMVGWAFNERELTHHVHMESHGPIMVALYFRNHGKPSRNVHGDDPKRYYLSFPDYNPSKPTDEQISVLFYTYDPKEHFKPLLFGVEFESTLTGFKGKHVYRTLKGAGVVWRDDPP